MACYTDSRWTDIYRGEALNFEKAATTPGHQDDLLLICSFFMFLRIISQAHINNSETKRLAEIGKSYKNPYDFGCWYNWYLFLGMYSDGVKTFYIKSHFIVRSC